MRHLVASLRQLKSTISIVQFIIICLYRYNDNDSSCCWAWCTKYLLSYKQSSLQPPLSSRHWYQLTPAKEKEFFNCQNSQVAIPSCFAFLTVPDVNDATHFSLQHIWLLVIKLPTFLYHAGKQKERTNIRIICNKFVEQKLCVSSRTASGIYSLTRHPT